MKKLTMITLAAIAGVGAARAQDSSAAAEWTIEEIQDIVNEVRAGRSLQPKSWPGGAKVAVLYSMDPDNETIALRFGKPTIGTLNEYAYGARVGLGRFVDLMDKHKIPATFFIPAVSLIVAPEQADLIKRSGRHEFAVHGWIHEDPSSLTREKEKELLERSIATIEHYSGERPTGYRAPSWNFSKNTLDIIRELGFFYDSSLMADDSPYEILQRGEPTGIVELPVSWIPDDASFLLPRGDRAISPRDFLTILKDEFDLAYEEGGMFILTLHPFVIGRRSSFVVLEEFIDYVRSKKGVWYATHQEAAEYVAREAGLAE